MSIIHLQTHAIRVFKRGLVLQSEAKSVHVSEGIARALGFRSHAALLAHLNNHQNGYYRRFDQEAFLDRLKELSPETPRRDLDLDLEHLYFQPSGHAMRYVAGMLKDPVLQVCELHTMGIKFCLKGLPQDIEVKLTDWNGYTRFQRSHAIWTPVQLGPYNPSRDFDDDPDYALHRAVESLASYYRDAVKAGHEPQLSWLVPQRTLAYNG